MRQSLDKSIPAQSTATRVKMREIGVEVNLLYAVVTLMFTHYL